MVRYFYAPATYEFFVVQNDEKRYPQGWCWERNADACMKRSPYGKMFFATFDGSMPYILPRDYENKNGNFDCKIVFSNQPHAIPCTELKDVPFCVKAGLYHAYNVEKFAHGFEFDMLLWSNIPLEVVQ